MFRKVVYGFWRISKTPLIGLMTAYRVVSLIVTQHKTALYV